jgi:hypothetical protein
MIYLAASFFFAAAFDAVKKLSFACFTAHPDVYIRQEHHDERSVNYWRTWSTLDLRPADAVYKSGTGMPNNCHGTPNFVGAKRGSCYKYPGVHVLIPFPRSATRRLGNEWDAAIHEAARDGAAGDTR